MWSRARSRRPVDASIHAASSSALARSRIGGVAGRVERRQDPLCASAVAQHDPGPAEPVDESAARPAGRASMLHANRGVELARSARAKARYSAWRLLRTPCVEDSAASANHAACAARAASVIPASVIASRAKARMLSSSR